MDDLLKLKMLGSFDAIKKLVDVVRLKMFDGYTEGGFAIFDEIEWECDDTDNYLKRVK